MRPQPWCALGVALFAVACSNVLTRRPAPASNEDVAASVLATRVNYALMQEGVPGYAQLRIAADARTVTLEGALPTPESRAHALEVARTVEGVEAVVDRLTVGAPLVEEPR